MLSRKHDLYSTRRLAEAAKQRGHKADLIDTMRCYMNITSARPTIHYKGAELDKYDAVVPRIGASVTFYGAAVVRQLEMMNVFCVNDSVAITRARDKLRSLQLLAHKGIGMPVTGFARVPDDIDDLLAIVGGPPLVIKLLEGTQGVGVVLAETKKAAESVLQAFMGLKVNIIVQEYVKEAEGCDLRCIVLGDRVVATMLREAEQGEFRSNLHRGGKGRVTYLSTEERETAVRAAKAMGLSFAGVDILRSHRGPLVLEVNASPGLEGIETVTGKDIAHRVIRYIEKNAEPIKKSSRYQG
ncbi:MAG TPA: 30S ribosomal protein S6--L-glutamate ligase [Gammaproteobacteria bacterium]|nr:30S ribosomal protein S6--L-glutamate ligase [Gammaproteobacteria bacterium]